MQGGQGGTRQRGGRAGTWSQAGRGGAASLWDKVRGGAVGRWDVRTVAVAAALVVFLIVLLVWLLGGGAGSTKVGANGNTHKAVSFDTALADHTSQYDWTNLYDVDGVYEYIVDGQVQSRYGIDVSEHQGDIDWQAVANDGVEFAFIRVGLRGYGTGTIAGDSYFQTNLTEAQSNGIDCGVYFFSQAITEEEAREEADYVIAQLDDAPLEYPVVFDSELQSSGADRTAGLSNEEMTAIAKAFCEEIEAAGYTPMIYGNGSDLDRYNLDELDQWGVWAASYAVVPTVDCDFAIWQYTDSGTVDGIDGYVDLDIDLTGTW
jgi:lysozyme